MGKWCLHASSFIFYQIIIKVTGNQDRHKSSDEFDFWPLVSMAHLYVFWNEIWPWHIGLRWGIVALWATCLCPQLRRSWGGIVFWGCACVCSWCVTLFDTCMLSHIDSSWKNSWPLFFSVQVISLSGVMPLWKNQNEILSARYLEKYLS